MSTANAAANSLREAIVGAVKNAQANGALPETEMPAFVIEVPADRSHGDLAANAAMVSARAFRSAPRKIAETILQYLDLNDTYFSRCEIAGPGFMNFFYNDAFYASVIREILSEGEHYGRSDYGQGKRVLVAFVSANPTGPMHVGNARGGALGDTLSSVLEAAGYQVAREFYINDAGNQIEKFATSLEVRYLQMYQDGVEMPEDAYHGQDITDHAKHFAEINGDKYVSAPAEERRKALVSYALPLNIQGLERDLLKYRIKYDRWFRESTLHNSGAVADIVKQLAAWFDMRHQFRMGFVQLPLYAEIIDAVHKKRPVVDLRCDDHLRRRVDHRYPFRLFMVPADLHIFTFCQHPVSPLPQIKKRLLRSIPIVTDFLQSENQFSSAWLQPEVETAGGIPAFLRRPFGRNRSEDPRITKTWRPGCEQIVR